MAKKSGGLSRWFKEEWVDLSRPKPGGGFEPCGRPDASEGKYPKCVPKSKASRMTESQIDSAIRRKRRAETTQQREGKKPINVATVKKESKNVPANPKLYAKVKAEAKSKFDVYPSAYANGWLVQEYKRRGGTYRKVTKGDFPGHPFRGNQWTVGRGGGGTTDPKRLATGQTMTGRGSPEQLKAMALEGGFTYNPKRNEIRAKGVSTAVDSKHEEKHSVKDFEENGEQIIKDYVAKNAEALSQPTNHLGAWKDGGKIYLDVSSVKSSLGEAADVARTSSQLAIFDLNTFTEYSGMRSPTTGKTKYVAENKVSEARRNPALIDQIGKAAGDQGVMLIPAETIDDTTIPIIVRRILAMPEIGKGVKKGQPGVSAVHVPTIPKKKKKKDRELIALRMRMDAAMRKGDFPGHPFRGNQWTTGRGGALGGGLGMAREMKEGSTKESGVKRPNLNPMTAEGKESLKTLGQRIPIEQMRKQRAMLIEKYDGVGKATKSQVDKFCKGQKAGREGRGRAGGEARGNAATRQRRKSRLLKDFGNGHTAGCSYCGVKLGYSTMEVEKLDPVMGYSTPGNTVPACRGCNSSTSNKSPKEKMGVKFKRSLTKLPKGC